MSPFSIRDAVVSDVPTITGIYAHAVRSGTASFELEAPDETEMRRRFAALSEGGFPYIVATLQDEVVGYAYAGLHRPRPAYRFCLEDSIYIDPAAQGRGLGRILLDRLVAESEARGFRQMVAVIGDSAQAASIAVHRAAGFQMVGTIRDVGYKFDRWLDTVIMQRALGDGAESPPARERPI